jgi:hypothetical protein
MTSLPDLELNTDYQASAAAASDKVSASRLDGDHGAIVSWINDRLLPTLARLIRDDDTLVDGVVRYRNLHAEIIASLSGLTWLEACAVATTGAITLSGLQTIDGYTTLAGDRVLVTAQGSAIANGIYVAAVGSWARASDAASGATLAASVAVAITNGTAYGASWWKAAAAALVGSDSVTWLRINVPGVGTIPRGGTGATTPSAWPTPRRLMARVVAVANVAVAAPGATIDGITLVAGDRVLLTAQGTGAENGVWTWNGSTVAMTRPVDYPAAGALQAFLDLELAVREGTAYAGSVWRCTTTGAITIDATASAWSELPARGDAIPVLATATKSKRTLAARFAETLNVRDFGAIGDGVSRPLSTLFGTLVAAQVVYPNAGALTDELDGTAIQAAINASRRVYVPAGTYLVNRTIDPASVNQWLLGDGVNASGGSVLKWNGAGASTILKAPGGASRLDGLRIDGNSIATVSGIVADDTHQPGRAMWGTVDIANCPGVGFDLAITGAASGIYYCNFGTMRVQSCGTGVRLKTTTGTTAKVNANTWTHLVTLNNVTGLEINLADGNTWLFVDAENNTSVGIDVVAGTANVVWGGWLEGNTTWHLRVANDPAVERFAYFGNCTQDNKVSHTYSANRSVLLPSGNSYHSWLGGRWFCEELQMQLTSGGNYLDLVPNSLGFNRSSSAGYSFIDQKNLTAGTGLSLRVSIASAGDTPMVIADNGATGGRMGFFTIAAAGAPIAQPANANQAAITDSTGGTASLTLAAIAAGAAYTQADMVAVKNALASIAATHNAIRAALVGLGLIKGSA